MKFTIQQSKVVKELNSLATFILGSNAFMQQDNFKLEANKDKIQFSSYNGENSLLFELSGEVKEEGSVVIPGRILASLVQNLPDTELTFSFDDDNNQLLITGDGINYNFPLANGGDWRNVEYFVGDKFVMPAKTLVKNINKVTRAAATRDNQRPILEGTLFTVDSKEIVLASTDAFRICVRTFEHGGEGLTSDLGSIVHSKTLDIFSKLFKLHCDNEVNVKISIEDGKRIFLEVEGLFLIVSPVLGDKSKFPDWKRFLPQRLAVDVVLDKKEFVETHKRCALFIENKFRDPVVLNFGAAGELEVKVGPTVYGTAKEELEAKEVKSFNHADKYIIGLNTSFLNDGIFTVDGKYLRIRTTPDDLPQIAMISEEKEELANAKNFYILMPLRLK